MPVKVEPILEDYMNVSLILLHREKQVKFSMWMQTLLLPIVALVLVLMGRPIRIPLVIFAVALSAVWIFLYPKLFKRMINKKVEKMFRNKMANSPHFLDPYTVDYTDGGLIAKRNNEEFTALFDCLDLYLTDEDHLYIIGGGFDFILPRRAFPNDEIFEATKADIDFKIQIALRM
ncbi:MAG: hypothetical protein Q4Q17_01705 [Tissierellia bacterium]|nr:hypothetical protein [Tissierellia bacterium]